MFCRVPVKYLLEGREGFFGVPDGGKCPLDGSLLYLIFFLVLMFFDLPADKFFKYFLYNL